MSWFRLQTEEFRLTLVYQPKKLSLLRYRLFFTIAQNIVTCNLHFIFFILVTYLAFAKIATVRGDMAPTLGLTGLKKIAEAYSKKLGI